jgi:hypothetical protein
VLVDGDVKIGDAVVTQGVLQLTDGAAVRLLDAGPASTPAPEGGVQRGPLPPPAKGQQSGAPGGQQAPATEPSQATSSALDNSAAAPGANASASGAAPGQAGADSGQRPLSTSSQAAGG